MIKKLLPILIVTLLALVLVGIKIYPKIAPAISDHVASPKMPKQQPINKDNPIKKPAHTQHKDITKEPTLMAAYYYGNFNKRKTKPSEERNP